MIAIQRRWRTRLWLALGGSLGAALLTLALATGTLCLTSGCSSVGYLAQSASGHLQLMSAAKPVDDWLADPATSPALKERLALTQRLRDFAVSELKLPDNSSYRRYAALDRPAAVWNVVAAPELSLKLQTWCFPVVGCVGYRGYYTLAAAQTEGDVLRAQGLEVSVYPVPAYSTLGMSNWLGGDPLLSSFTQWPEGELARLIFHELTHQVVYVAGDTTFNESFANAVERLGAERWLQTHASAAARADYAALDQRRADVRALLGRYRDMLAALYQGPWDDDTKRQRKAELLAALQADYQVLKTQRWQGFAGYDGFFRQVNNASLGVQAAYHALVPAFEALYAQQGGDFSRFYAAVGEMAQWPAPQREARLKALLAEPQIHSFHQPLTRAPEAP